MTKQEKIIVSAYTGCFMCDFLDVYNYIYDVCKKTGNRIEGCPELSAANDFFVRDWLVRTREKVKRAVEPDFLALCDNSKSGERKMGESEKELKPCPFCGGGAIIAESKYPRLFRPGRNHPYYVCCCGCDLLFGYDVDYGGEFDSEKEAADAWNGRTR